MDRSASASRRTAMTTAFPYHQESHGDVTASIDAVFAYLDDPRHIAAHM
jgi:hypothetical protein